MTEPKTSRFHLTKKIDNNLKHDIDHIIKSNEVLAEYIIKKLHQAIIIPT